MAREQALFPDGQALIVCAVVSPTFQPAFYAVLEAMKVRHPKATDAQLVDQLLAEAISRKVGDLNINVGEQKRP